MKVALLPGVDGFCLVEDFLVVMMFTCSVALLRSEKEVRARVDTKCVPRSYKLARIEKHLQFCDSSGPSHRPYDYFHTDVSTRRKLLEVRDSAQETAAALFDWTRAGNQLDEYIEFRRRLMKQETKLRHIQASVWERH